MRKELSLEVKNFEMLPNHHQQLVLAAIAVRKKAYAPYSQFKVGAAIEALGCETLFLGCNMENAAYTGLHAEDGAIANMGTYLGCETRPYIVRIAVALMTPAGFHAVPCGGCRQKIREFGDDETVVLGARLDENGEIRDIECYKLDELLSNSFGPQNLGR